MPAIVVVGCQFGDEGKGKIIDLLAKDVDFVVRYNGGSNAGHRVVRDGKVFDFSLVPSGALWRKKLVIGNGVVIDPQILLREIIFLRRCGYPVDLKVSERAHITFPWHLLLDRRVGKGIGTTGKGVGPTYVDKVGRYEGIRAIDFVERGFGKKLEDVLLRKYSLLKKLEIVTSKRELQKYAEKIKRRYQRCRKFLRPLLADVSELLNSALDEGQVILFEGAQGTFLDIDHGTYPFVTSSSTIAAGACTGCGISPKRIDKVIGVCKAYTTRVGKGPLLTQMDTKLETLIRKKGKEYGVVTGRPRRCGWLDLVMLSHAHRINRFDEMVITKIDVLESIDPLKICTAYELNGKKLRQFPPSLEILRKCKPLYEQVEGWARSNWEEIARKGYRYLPTQTKAYLKMIEEFIGVPMSIVSVGPTPQLTLWRD